MFGSARMGIRYKIANTGHSPAIRLAWDAAIIPLTDTRLVADEIMESQNAMCFATRKSPKQLMETAVFPGDEIPEERFIGIDQRGIADATAKRYAKSPNAPDKFVSLVLIMCFDYQMSFAAEHGQTRYAFMIAKLPPDGGYNPSVVPRGTYPDLHLVYFNQSAN